MNSALISSVVATLWLIFPAILSLRPIRRQNWFLAALLLFSTIPSSNALSHLTGPHWSAALGADLWVTVIATEFLFALVCFRNRPACQIVILVQPYLIILGILACFSASLANVGISESAPLGWVGVHILVSVTTLGLLTLAANAAMAAFIQSRALKKKRPTALSRLLPAVRDSERLYEGLLLASEIVLAVGVATGMATEFAETGRLLVLDHKTLFSLLAFALIGGLIAGRRWGGVRGQMAVRLMLVAYSFVLLGYFGVKFVKQVLLP